MGNFGVKMLVFIFACLLSFVNGQNLMENIDDITGDSDVDETLLKCQYDLMTGDHICDCHNRNTVLLIQITITKFNQFFLVSIFVVFFF